MTNESHCNKCQHGKGSHRDNICYGDQFCTCIKFVEPPDTPLNKIPQLVEYNVIKSRTEIPLPIFITTHDNWTGKGWEYQKKWGKTQSEMVEFLTFRCGLYEDEVRQFLRCKAASVRGRLSEIRSRTLKTNNCVG